MMFENIEILLEYRNLSIFEILNFLINNDNFKNLKFIEYLNNELSNKNDYEISASNTFSNIENIKIFDKEEIQLLQGYFSVMGKTDLQGQISNCRLYKEFFKQKLNRLESEEDIKCKSTGTFIIGTGILIIIVLI